MPAQVRFAQAHAQADGGAEDVALRLYRSLEDDSPLGQAARYNSANLLMRQAVVVQAGEEPGKEKDPLHHRLRPSCSRVSWSNFTRSVT